MVSRESRAKQFLPFDALNGFYDALKERETEYIDKAELSDEVKEHISNVLCSIEKKDIIKVRYYTPREYIDIVGIVEKVDPIKKKIVFINEVKIDFENIVNIKKV